MRGLRFRFVAPDTGYGQIAGNLTIFRIPAAEAVDADDILICIFYFDFRVICISLVDLVGLIVLVARVIGRQGDAIRDLAIPGVGDLPFRNRYAFACPRGNDHDIRVSHGDGAGCAPVT